MSTTICNNPNIFFDSSKPKKISVRLPLWRRTIIDYCSDQFHLSISDLVSLAIDFLFILEEIPHKGEISQKAKEKIASMNLLGIAN
jgi:hypothetical protein